MKLPERKDCIHSAVCKFDDGMCPMECGHFTDYNIHSLIDAAIPIIEIFKPGSEAQKKWKKDWLKKAKELTQNKEA